jgi:hypothetical protein
VNPNPPPQLRLACQPSFNKQTNQSSNEANISTMPWHAEGVSGHAVPILDLPSSILFGCGFATLCPLAAISGFTSRSRFIGDFVPLKKTSIFLKDSQTNG